MARKTRKSRKPRKHSGGAPKGNKNAVGNKGGGRHSTYKPEYAEVAKRACEKLGYTDSKLAVLFGVTQRAIDKWKLDFVEFRAALNGSKPIADECVKESLYHRAMGYSHDAVKIIPRAGKAPLLVPYREHFPPDTAACIFWLKNRQPGKWRDKQEVAHDLSDPLAALLREINGKTRGLPDT